VIGPKTKKQQYFVGIDEAGRGPLAGPVAVGVVVAYERDLLLPYFNKKIKDSKQLSEHHRRKIFDLVHQARIKKQLSYAVAFSDSRFIDKNGINTAIYVAIKKALKILNVPKNKSFILLDGGLRAPKEYRNQKTIIRGDESESLIALASIMAKVLRDKKMKYFAKQYPKYLFEKHNGYGTKTHRKLIKKYKPCPIHRKTFLGNII